MPRGTNTRRSDVRYRRNPPPPRHLQFGRRVRDGQSGFPTYEKLLVPDEFGLMVDPQFGGYDLNDKLGKFQQ